MLAKKEESIYDPEGYNRNISWDHANRITAITVPGTSSGVPTITIPGITNAMSVNQSYGYDQLDRLTNFTAGYLGATTPATGQGLLPSEAFTFDAIGNRLSRTATPPGGSTATATYAYPNASATPAPNRNHTLASISGAQVNAYTYDATGNTKTESAAQSTLNPTTNAINASINLTHTYDAKNRLKITQIGATSTDTVTYKSLASVSECRRLAQANTPTARRQQSTQQRACHRNQPAFNSTPDTSTTNRDASSVNTPLRENSSARRSGLMISPLQRFDRKEAQHSSRSGSQARGQPPRIMRAATRPPIPST